MDILSRGQGPLPPLSQTHYQEAGSEIVQSGLAVELSDGIPVLQAMA